MAEDWAQYLVSDPNKKPEVDKWDQYKVSDTKDDEPNTLASLWHRAISPTVNLIPKDISEHLDEHTLDETPFGAKLKGFTRGAAEGLSDTVSSLSSPLNIATAGMGSLEELTGSNIARLGTKILSAPVLAHGAHTLFSPNSTMNERLSSIPEIAGGFLGLRSRTPEIAQRAMEQQPSTPNISDILPEEELQHRPDLIPVGHENEFNDYRRNEPIDLEGKTLDLASTRQNMGRPNLSVDDVNKLFSNSAPLREGTTVNFGRRNIQPKQDITITEPKELNTDLVRNIYMKENPSDASSPNILMKEPNADKVKEANSYGYKSAGFTADGSLKLERKGTYPKTTNPANNESLAQSIYDLPRGLMSVDPPFITSAAFRQAGPWIGTKQWFKSWIPAAKAFGSETASKNIMDSINNHPLVKDTLDMSGNIQPGPLKKWGVSFTGLDEGLNNREEALRGQLAEKIPGYGKYVRASNRAYTAYLNTLRLGAGEDLVNGAQASNSFVSKMNPFSSQAFGAPKDVLNNDVLGKQIADLINNTTGRGSLGPLENHVRLLSNTLFSPRGIAARIQQFNPMNYTTTDPFIRQQYVKAMARQVTAWWTMAGLSQLVGATVSRDPNNADFGKIKIGNTRIDPPGGLQQFLVLGNRMLPESMGGGGVTSSVSGRFTPFGQGYKPPTRMSTIGQFATNRLHPSLQLAWKFLDAQPNKSFHMGDEIVKSILPMYAGDIMDVAKDNPGLLPITIPLSGAGMGTQSYEKGSYGKPTFIPEEYDLNFGARRNP